MTYKDDKTVTFVTHPVTKNDNLAKQRFCKCMNISCTQCFFVKPCNA